MDKITFENGLVFDARAFDLLEEMSAVPPMKPRVLPVPPEGNSNWAAKYFDADRQGWTSRGSYLVEAVEGGCDVITTRFNVRAMSNRPSSGEHWLPPSA